MASEILIGINGEEIKHCSGYTETSQLFTAILIGSLIIAFSILALINMSSSTDYELIEYMFVIMILLFGILILLLPLMINGTMETRFHHPETYWTKPDGIHFNHQITYKQASKWLGGSE